MKVELSINDFILVPVTKGAKETRYFIRSEVSLDAKTGDIIEFPYGKYMMNPIDGIINPIKEDKDV